MEYDLAHSSIIELSPSALSTIADVADLTARVVRMEGCCYRGSGLVDIYRGQWMDGRTVEVQAYLLVR